MALSTPPPSFRSSRTAGALACAAAVLVAGANLVACGSPPAANVAPAASGTADSGAPGDAPDASAAAIDASAPPSVAWEDVDSSVCGVRAKMVGTPKESVQMLQTEQGPAKLTMLMYETPDHGSAMGIMCSEVAALKTSKTSNDHILDGSRDGMLKNVHGTLTSEKAFTLGGYPGRQVSIMSKGKQFSARIVFLRAKAKILTVIVVGFDEPTTTSFLESVAFR